MHIDWQTLANVATAFALIVAAATFIWQVISSRHEKAYSKSHFALQAALDSYNQAVALLSDNNNDRVTWITAARIIERANEISTKVTERVHVDVLEVQLERYRRQMAGVLGYDDPSKGAWFFYGATEPLAIDSAARESTKSVTTAQGRIGRLNSLSESALATVYAMASYPSGYEDPLRASFEGKIGIELRAGFPGLFEYLTHRAQYESVNGNLVRRPENAGSDAMS